MNEKEKEYCPDCNNSGAVKIGDEEYSICSCMANKKESHNDYGSPIKMIVKRHGAYPFEMILKSEDDEKRFQEYMEKFDENIIVDYNVMCRKNMKVSELNFTSPEDGDVISITINII